MSHRAWIVLLAAAWLLAGAGVAAAQQPDSTGMVTIDPSVYGPTVDQIMDGPGSDDEKLAALQQVLARDPRNVAAYNAIGLIHMRRQEWEAARDAFLRAVQANPRLPETHRNLGLALARLGMFDLALREFDAYARLGGPAARDAWRLAGDALRRAGRLDLARRRLEEGLRALSGPFDGEKARTVMALVQVLEKADDTAAADSVVAAYAPAAHRWLAEQGTLAETDKTKADPGLAAARVIVNRRLSALTREARLLLDAGMAQQAADRYRQAMDLAPEHDELLGPLAEALLAAGKTMEAEVAARRAADQHPDRPGGWIALGRIAEADHRPRDAIAAYRKAWQLDKDDMGLAGRIAQLYLEINDLDSAQRFLADAVSRPDAPPELLLNYALTLQRQEHYRASIPPLRRAVRLKPDMLPAWRALAKALRRTRQWREAARAYDHCLALKPDDARLAFQKGYCLLRQERYAEAAAAFRRAVELDPDYDKAYVNLGLALVRTEDYAGALAAFEKALDHRPDDASLLINKSICLYKLGRYEEAVAILEPLLEKTPSVKAWNTLGLVYDAMGEKAEARRCYKQAKLLQQQDAGGEGQG